MHVSCAVLRLEIQEVGRGTYVRVGVGQASQAVKLLLACWIHGNV